MTRAIQETSGGDHPAQVEEALRVAESASNRSDWWQVNLRRLAAEVRSLRAALDHELVSSERHVQEKAELCKNLRCAGAAQEWWRPRLVGSSLNMLDDAAFAVLNSAGYRGAATYVDRDGRATYDTPEMQVHICDCVTHWMPLPEPPEARQERGNG